MKAGETLFIDDSAANCEGARSLGINAMHIDLGRKDGCTCLPTDGATGGACAPVWQL